MKCNIIRILTYIFNADNYDIASLQLNWC